MRVRDFGRGRGEPDPRMAEALAAIEAAMAGEPTDPDHAELCEIALLVAAERPVPAGGELAALQRAVDTRFASAPAAAVAPGGAAPPRRRPPRWRRPAWGGAAAALVAGGLAAIVVALPGGGSSSAVSSTAASSAAASGASAAAGASSHAPAGVASSTSASSAAAPRRGLGLYGAITGRPDASSANGALVPQAAAAPGRQVVQGAQVNLQASPARIDAVAQEVFDVVGAENGIVLSSTVNSGGAASAYATFSLSIPSANLSQALRLLSTLRDAQVLSRTDTTNDITGTVGAAGMRLAEDRALRRSLLRQLAAATTSAQVAALKAQLHALDGRIAVDTGKLNGLHRQVANSHVTVTIQPAPPAPVPVHHGSGFTLGRALHDAGRVLVVAAGVALIALAVAIPLGLLGGLAVWIWVTVRRRRREAALDLI